MLTESLNQVDLEENNSINKEDNKNSKDIDRIPPEQILKINTVLIKPEEVKTYGNRLIDDCKNFSYLHRHIRKNRL
jgi:hypothetical protein